MVVLVNKDLEVEVAARMPLDPVCRVCLTRGTSLKCLHTDEELSVPPLQDFFTVLTTLQVHLGAGFSNKICQTCKTKVLAAYELRKLAQQSDIALRSLTESPGSQNEQKRKYECGTCSKAFPYKSELERHEQTHTPHYACGTCTKVFGFKSSLRRHERQHLRASHVQCSLCSSLFKDEQLLKRHLQYAHKGARHACDLCPAELGSATALRAHRRRHTARDDRPLRCHHPGCERAFNFQHQRRLHEATHTGAKYHRCDHCGAGFVQAHHLAAHAGSLRAVAGCRRTPSVARAPRTNPPPGVKLFVCGTCGKQLSTNHRLQTHLQACHIPRVKNNSMKDNLVCNVCGKLCARTYLKKHQLNCHRKTTTESNNNNTFSVNEDNSTLKESLLKSECTLKYGEVIHTEEHKNLTGNVPQDDMNVLQLSDESELNRQEVVRDVVDMMEASDQSSTGHGTQPCPAVRGASTNIEDAFQSLTCNRCSQNSCSENLNLSGAIDKVTSTLQPMIAKVDVGGCCKEVRLEETQSKDKSIAKVADRTLGTDCKQFLGNCIVSNGAGGTTSEDCICAKVNYEHEAPLPEYLTTPLLMALEQQGYYPS